MKFHLLVLGFFAAPWLAGSGLRAQSAELNAVPEERLRNSDSSSLARTLRMIEELRILEPSMSEAEVFANIRSIQNNSSQNRFTFNRAIDQIALSAIASNHHEALGPGSRR